MKISVCLKRVPDTATKIRIGSDGKSIDYQGVQYVISPYDEFAIEEAIRIKESAGEGSVTVITLGPDSAQQDSQSCFFIVSRKDEDVHVCSSTSFPGFQTCRRGVLSTDQNSGS